MFEMSGQEGTHSIIRILSLSEMQWPRLTHQLDLKLRCTGLGNSCDKCSKNDAACVTEPTSKQRGGRKCVTEKTGTAYEVITTPGEGDRVGCGSRSPPTTDPDLPPRYLSNAELQQSLQHSSELRLPIRLPRITEILDVSDYAARRQQQLQQQEEEEEEEEAEEEEEKNSFSTDKECSSDDGFKPPCGCIEDALDLVQKLDDDAFRLGTLTFDQTLKVYKLLITQCLRSLDCARCADEAAAHTVVLILCDGAAQMMWGLSGRLERLTASRRTSGVRRSNPGISSSSSNVASVASPAASDTFVARLGMGSNHDGERWRPLQLPGSNNSLDSSGGGGESGLYTECYNAIFSHEIQAQYSDEELFHIIRELAWIQVRNMYRLLKRVESMPQVKRVPARVGKIQALRQKMGETTARMDQWFEAMLVHVS